MRRTLGTLLILLVTLLAGCGGETDEPRAEDTSPTGPTSSAATTGPVEHTLVAILSETNAGGEVAPAPVALDTGTAVDEFVQGFDSERFGDKIRTAVAGTDVPTGRVLVGAVVAIGCEVPSDVAVQRTADGLSVTAVKSGKSPMECFAPVTSVALLLVEAEAAG